MRGDQYTNNVSVTDQPRLQYLKSEDLSKEELEKLLAKLKLQSKEMQNKFASIVVKTIMSLNKNNKTVQDLELLMKFSSAKGLCNLFEEGMSINDLFLKLGDYLSFFDYELLELIIKEYCSGLSTELEKYKSDLKEYCRRRIVEVPMNVIESKRTNENVIRVKYDKEFCSVTLNDIKDLEVRLAQLLEMDLCLLGVEEGCTQIVLVSTCFISPLTDQQKDKLIKMKLLEFHTKNVHFESKTHLRKTQSKLYLTGPIPNPPPPPPPPPPTPTPTHHKQGEKLGPQRICQAETTVMHCSLTCYLSMQLLQIQKALLVHVMKLFNFPNVSKRVSLQSTSYLSHSTWQMRARDCIITMWDT